MQSFKRFYFATFSHFNVLKFNLSVIFYILGRTYFDRTVCATRVHFAVNQKLVKILKEKLKPLKVIAVHQISR